MPKKKGSILIIDDDQDVLYTAKIILKQHYDNVVIEDTPNRIEALLSKDNYDVILLDMNFKPGATGGNEGLFWLKKIHKINPSSKVVLNTAYGDINLAVQAMKEGAIDFLVKPWEKEKLISTVNTVYQLNTAQKEVSKLKSKQEVLVKDLSRSSVNLIAESEAMKSILVAIEKVAVTDANVLILGENGTGKELIARTIHNKSKRSKEVFINVDLGALSATLFESELFGYQKGAFTDAKENRTGRFEVANGGTIFLDEIGNISLNEQAKLLSVIQNGEVTPLGSTNVKKVDTRLICATNKPLYNMVDSETFRQDLLYRINTVEISLPPLRQRTKDIETLTYHYLDIYAHKYEKGRLVLASDLMEKLKKYSWPGNIRELEHAVERAVIMSSDSVIGDEDFNLKQQPIKSYPQDNLNIEEVEKITIENALDKNNGNLTQAAKELGLGRSTLYRKMEKYGI